MNKMIWKNFEFKMAAIIFLTALSLSLSIYLVIYHQHYELTINKLKEDAHVVYQYAQDVISECCFLEINTPEDEKKDIYIDAHNELDEIRRIANIRYLYTAKLDENGKYIYVLDGLDPNSGDFRHVGDPIEKEIIPALTQCLDGKIFMDDKMINTEWGYVYVTYFPFHDSAGKVIGAIGMEFDCESLHDSINRVMFTTVIISLGLMCVFITTALFTVRKVVRNTEEAFEGLEKSIFQLKTEANKIYYDALTGIYNRRFFDDTLKRVIKYLSRSGGCLSMMMVDIDFFKAFNDMYGHYEGDKCLKIIAETLSKSVAREDDFVARYGGEEFVIVLPNTDRDGAGLIAHKLLENIRKCGIPHGNSSVADCVTVSIGVVTDIVSHTDGVDDYIKKADEMLYKSKQSGRNKYSLSNLSD